MLHVVDSGGPDRLATGDRVTVRFRPAAERIGAMADIEAFVPEVEGGRPDERPTRPTGRRRVGAVGPVTTLATPIRLDFDFTPGVAQSRFLRGLEQGKFMGQRARCAARSTCPPAGRAPPTACPPPRTWSWPTSGTVTTYCVVNVPFAGQSIEIPYICAQILLDGANLSFMGLIQEIPTDQIRMGMRVEAVWVDPDDLEPVTGLGQVLPAQRRARRRLRDVQGVPVSAAPATDRRRCPSPRSPRPRTCDATTSTTRWRC